MNSIQDHIWNMSIAFDEAKEAWLDDEVPVGAVIVSESGKVIAKARNNKEAAFNPCGHAEIIAITRAAEELNNWRLEGCTLYVTLEPCIMCLGAMIQARIKKLVFGAYDNKAGALTLGYNLYKDHRLNHKFSVTGGINHFQCSKLISDFFREKRKSYKIKS